MDVDKNEISISVIISTYNHPEWLQKVLWGYEVQTFKNFEIVIADDGSDKATFDLIDNFKISSNLSINHVWHEDNGFQKSEILNKAILATKADYLIFSDGDCIPKNNFIQIHEKNKKTGHFISGGYFMLPMNTSKIITKENVYHQQVFEKEWLYNNGVAKTFKMNKLSSTGFIEKMMNAITPTKATWNGHNSSGWKADIIKVNGFDERMQYGGQDRELGERLINLGIQPIQLRYSAIVVHLDHKRGYKTQDSIDKNKGIRKKTRSEKIVYTPFGISKH